MTAFQNVSHITICVTLLYVSHICVLHVSAQRGSNVQGYTQSSINVIHGITANFCPVSQLNTFWFYQVPLIEENSMPGRENFYYLTTLGEVFFFFLNLHSPLPTSCNFLYTFHTGCEQILSMGCNKNVKFIIITMLGFFSCMPLVSILEHISQEFSVNLMVNLD